DRVLMLRNGRLALDEDLHSLRDSRTLLLRTDDKVAALLKKLGSGIDPIGQQESTAQVKRNRRALKGDAIADRTFINPFVGLLGSRLPRRARAFSRHSALSPPKPSFYPLWGGPSRSTIAIPCPRLTTSPVSRRQTSPALVYNT
ncbi:MAG: hypothetical protein ACPGNT_11265, partial [Rhodospirillales bacterium]